LLVDFLTVTFRTVFGMDRISSNEHAVEAGVVPECVVGDSDSWLGIASCWNCPLSRDVLTYLCF